MGRASPCSTGSVLGHSSTRARHRTDTRSSKHGVKTTAVEAMIVNSAQASGPCFDDDSTIHDTQSRLTATSHWIPITAQSTVRWHPFRSPRSFPLLPRPFLPPHAPPFPMGQATFPRFTAAQPARAAGIVMGPTRATAPLPQPLTPSSPTLPRRLPPRAPHRSRPPPTRMGCLTSAML